MARETFAIVDTDSIGTGYYTKLTVQSSIGVIVAIIACACPRWSGHRCICSNASVTFRRTSATAKNSSRITQHTGDSSSSSITVVVTIVTCSTACWRQRSSHEGCIGRATQASITTRVVTSSTSSITLNTT